MFRELWGPRKREKKDRTNGSKAIVCGISQVAVDEVR